MAIRPDQLRDFDPTPRRGAKGLGRMGSCGHGQFDKVNPIPGWEVRLESWTAGKMEQIPMPWETARKEPRCVRCGEKLIDREMQPVVVLREHPVRACCYCVEVVRSHFEERRI